MAKKEDEHPLRLEDVFRRAGIQPLVTDRAAHVTCDECGQRQTLAEASLELAEDPNDITAYRCVNGCAVVVVTGFPSPIALPDSGRYRLGDYVVAAVVTSGFDFSGA